MKKSNLSANKSAKVESKEIVQSAKVISANEKIIAQNSALKHNIEGRKNKSAKELKSERTKNRSALIRFANDNFLSAHNQKKDEQISNAKSFLSYVKNHYLYTNLNFVASDLYSAKDVKKITDIQNLIDFCKSSKLELKVYEDLKA